MEPQESVRIENLQKLTSSLSTEMSLMSKMVPREIQKIQKKVDALERSINNLMNMNSQILSYMGDNETKFETFKTILIRKDIMNADSFDSTWDEIKGIRVRDNDERIEKGDFARIDFDIINKESGEIVSQEKDFPVRVGSGNLVIDEKLVGTRVRDHTRSFEHTYPEDSEQNANETVLFNICIKKVRTKIEVKPDDATSH